MATIMPMNIAFMGLTKPQAGVMATRPATAPVAVPRMEGDPLCHHSTSAQVRPAAAVAVLVVTKALAARPSAASALPALNPNQPNQRSDAPRTVKGRLCGRMGLWL